MVIDILFFLELSLSHSGWLPGMTLLQELEVQGRARASGAAGLLLSSLPVPLSALWLFLVFTFPPAAQDSLWQGQAAFCSFWGLPLHCLSPWNLLGWHQEHEAGQLNSKHFMWSCSTLGYSIYWGWGSSACSLSCPAECNKTWALPEDVLGAAFPSGSSTPTATSLLWWQPVHGFITVRACSQGFYFSSTSPVCSKFEDSHFCCSLSILHQALGLEAPTLPSGATQLIPATRL